MLTQNETWLEHEGECKERDQASGVTGSEKKIRIDREVML
jgi:hypothetical protein